MTPKEKRPAGWCTLLYTGSLTLAETKKLNGKMIAVGVQLVRHAGPVSALNPAGGCLNPTSGETIATVSAPYLSDGGAINLD